MKNIIIASAVSFILAGCYGTSELFNSGRFEYINAKNYLNDSKYIEISLPMKPEVSNGAECSFYDAKEGIDKPCALALEVDRANLLDAFYEFSFLTVEIHSPRKGSVIRWHTAGVYGFPMGPGLPTVEAASGSQSYGITPYRVNSDKVKNLNIYRVPLGFVRDKFSQVDILFRIPVGKSDMRITTNVDYRAQYVRLTLGLIKGEESPRCLPKRTHLSPYIPINLKYGGGRGEADEVLLNHLKKSGIGFDEMYFNYLSIGSGEVQAPSKFVQDSIDLSVSGKGVCIVPLVYPAN